MPDTHGSTHPRSSAVSTVGRAADGLFVASPAPFAPEAVFRMPQPPPILVSNGTVTLCVISMTESTTPASPQ